MNPLPPALSIAGSDNSSGAGIQADLKTMSALGTYGLTAVTCVVAEIPGTVSAIHPVPAEIVAEQIRLCLEAFPVRALKTGMLFSAEILRTVTTVLARQFIGRNPPPLVVDPVMVATSGHRLLNEDALDAYRNGLFPLATLVTPNLDEAAVLLGRPIHNRSELCEAGRSLVREFNVAFLMKGGHLKDKTAADVLIQPDGASTGLRHRMYTAFPPMEPGAPTRPPSPPNLQKAPLWLEPWQKPSASFRPPSKGTSAGKKTGGPPTPCTTSAFIQTREGRPRATRPHTTSLR